MKKYIFALWLVLASAGFVFAGPPCIPPIPESGSPTYLTIDLTGITDTNIPAMQAAGAGFGDSPLWATDASTVTLKAATGQPAVLSLSADAAEDNSDKWRIQGADGGNVTLETYQSGAWVAVATWTNAGGYTVTGALAGTTLDTGQGANELYDMDQDVKTTSSPSFVAVTEGVNAVPNATDPLSFFAATTSAQLAGVLSDETGTDKVVFSTSPTLVTPLLGTPTSGTLTNCTGLPISTGVSGLGANVATFLATPSSANLASAVSDETGTLKAVFSDSPTFTTQITTPAITAPAASLVIKPTTDAVTAVQVQDKDGNNILNVDTVNNRVAVGTATPDTAFHAEIDDATTNATTNVQTLTHTTSGTPAANIGAGLAFEVETAAANNEVVGVIEGIATDVTPAAEVGAVVVKTMKAGAAATETARFTSTGMSVTGEVVDTHYETIYIPAASMSPTSTSGAVLGSYEYATNDIQADYLGFNGATEQFATFMTPFPAGWDRSTVKVKFYWSSATGSTAGDTVEWEIAGGALSDDDAIDAALGTAQVISDVLLADSGADMQTSGATPALTVGGTPALGDMLVWKVSRNVAGTDDCSEDAWLMGALIQIKVTNAEAAW